MACGEWNTLSEFSVESAAASVRTSELKPQKLSEIPSSKHERIKSDILEFDRVVGGGIVPGSIILVGGEPGIGKSTLLLQISAKIGKALYISGEESLGQIKERADRLKVDANRIELVADGDLEAIEQHIRQTSPSFIIIDSIQTVFLNSVPSTAGSLVQVRESGLFLQRLAKTSGIPIVIVGHVTKEGSIAGPRTLEHLVDVVLYFEGDRYHDIRILRGVKNRFGPTNEVGIFTIQGEGLVEVRNPSDVFLEERQKSPGSVITATLEGTRPILVEVQALVTPTHFGYPRRMSSGFDLNRLNLLAAVISKTTNVNLSNHDIYLNVTGGIKLQEPSVDLAVVASIISSYKNTAIPADLCLFGEVGLSGEIRRVRRQQDRTKEAEGLGFRVAQDTRHLSQIMNLFA